MSLLTHVVDWLVPFICGGVATVLGLMWRWGKAMVNGCLLYTSPSPRD